MHSSYCAIISGLAAQRESVFVFSAGMVGLLFSEGFHFGKGEHYNCHFLSPNS